MHDDPTGEVTELLQQLIRNRCVNDGQKSSGQEVRSADVLRTYLEGGGLDVETYEPAPGRRSLVVRIEGTQPSAPSLMYMGHTDVVPADPAGWTRDPFGGELVDGEVWGRGAIDMLNLTASMAVATRRLARGGFRPKGTLVYLAVADEEALGTWGAGWLTDHARDAVGVDYVVTESGGVQVPTADGVRLQVTTAEKGAYWVRLAVGGTSSHGSRPLRTDNALVTTAEVVRRLAAYRPPARIDEAWRRWVAEIGLSPEVQAAVTDPNRLDAMLEELPLSLARHAHACTHTTLAPTVIHGGVKTNVIPDRVEIDVDIRTLPGQTGADIQAMLADAIGDLWARVDLTVIADDRATASSPDTPLWDSLSRASQAMVAGSRLIPNLSVGATDSRFFRDIGATCYGYGLFGPKMESERYSQMFHGDDERVDQESLRLSTLLWEAVAEDFLNP